MLFFFVMQGLEYEGSAYDLCPKLPELAVFVENSLTERRGTFNYLQLVDKPKE